MIVGYRQWAIRRVQVGIRRVPTGRRVPVLPEPLTWPLEQATALDLLTRPLLEAPEVIEVPIWEDHLIGLPGTPNEWSWQPGVDTAACASYARHIPPVDHDPAPLVGPGCGFYALKTLDLLDPVHPPTAADGRAGGCFCAIPGLVGLSGEVTEGPLGYRASHARVLALLATPTWRQRRHLVGSGCPCGHCDPMLTVGDPWEPAEVHLQGLADRYQVPIFANPADLDAYAAELATPSTWPVTDVPLPHREDTVAADRLARKLRAAIPGLRVFQSFAAMARPAAATQRLAAPPPRPAAWWGAGSPPPGVLPRRRPGRGGS